MVIKPYAQFLLVVGHLAHGLHQLVPHILPQGTAEIAPGGEFQLLIHAIVKQGNGLFQKAVQNLSHPVQASAVKLQIREFFVDFVPVIQKHVLLVHNHPHQGVNQLDKRLCVRYLNQRDFKLLRQHQALVRERADEPGLNHDSRCLGLMKAGDEVR